MPARQHALELVLAPGDDTSVRARWQVLEDAGVASSARHRGATHRPHVTVLGGPPPEAAVLRVAAARWAPLLPLTMPVAGLVLLEGRRPALAELLVPSAGAVAAHAELCTVWLGADNRPWVPHLTLAPRLDLGDATTALTALAEGGSAPTRARVAVALRWWDPEQGSVHTVTGQD